MKKLLLSLLCVAGIASSHADTVTSGATVSLNGTFFTDSGGWGPGAPAAAQDLVSGVFQPEQTQWNINSVWWNGYDNPANNIVLDLNGTFNITSLTMQADDNDTYEIDYLAPGSAIWQTAWVNPPPGPWGLVTSSTTLGAPITATALRFEALGGDGYYAVSQIEATGSAVPDAASTFGLVGVTIALLGAVRRYRRS